MKKKIILSYRNYQTISFMSRNNNSKRIIPRLRKPPPPCPRVEQRLPYPSTRTRATNNSINRSRHCCSAAATTRMFAAACYKKKMITFCSAANSLGNFPQEIYRGTSLPAALSPSSTPFASMFTKKRNVRAGSK